jgi:hypothetical protein
MNETSTEPRAALVFESMFGSTRQIAEAIEEGLRESAIVWIMPVKDAPESFGEVDLLIVGAPTHVHGLSRPSTRIEAGKWGDDPERKLTLEPDAAGIGVREWLETCGTPPALFAAFDTRADMPEIFSGSAASAIDKSLRKQGSHRIAPRESFLVDRTSGLEPGELDRARDWGRALGVELLERHHQ